MEPLNLGNEGGKSSRRRLSSILKVSRTSMREPGAEQEVQQEEITKPIEKKRNSRRVSFAATKNVRVFSKDAKGESPVLATAQNTTVGEHRQDEKILGFVDEGNQIKGLDTLLNTPLYVSQHLSKENFFSDPVLQDDCVDRTMLLGEDTGYMDMTHSHTIMIDKDYENDEMNPNFGLKVTQKITGGQIVVAGQKGLSCDTKVEPKNPAMDPDFNAFLASISLPTVKNSVQKKERGGLIICSANTSTSEIDKENQLPPFLIKQVQPSIGKGDPQLLPQGLQRRRSRVAFSEDDDMETTKSHTVVIENKSNDQPVLSFVSGNNASMAFSREDDMELTQSQTAAINVRLTGNISSNVQSALDQNRSHYFSENDDAMDMTGTFDLSRRENEYTVSMKKEAPISKASKMSSFSVFGNGEMMDRNEPNFSMVQTAYSDEMEMTEALDVPVQEQEHTARMKNESLLSFHSVSKKSSINLFGSGEIMDPNKSGHFSVAQTVNSDDMEMTQCQTIVLEAKQISGDQPLSNSRKSFPHAASIKERALLQIHKPSKMSSNNGISNEAIMDRNNLSIAQTTNSDDMEMTRCQTIVLEAKQISGDQPLSNSRKSFPHGASITEGALLQIHKQSKMFSNNGIRNEPIMDRNNLSMAQTTNSDDMEMTEALEVSVQDSFSQISKKSYFNLTKNAEINKSYHLPIAQTADSDDMEMTRCQTIVLEAEQVSGDKPSSNLRKSFSNNMIRKEELMNQNKSSNLSIAQDINSDDMEMTEALEVSVQDKEYTVSEKEKMSLQSSKISKRSFNLTGNVEVIDQTANIDDMEMTQCQTVILEAKQFSGDTLRRSLVTKSSDGMDMTQAFTGRIVLNPHSTSKKVKQQSILLPTSKHNLSDSMNKTGEPSTFAGIAPPSPDEMELTGCTTVNIDSNPTWLASAADTTSTRRANQTITVAVPMEMTRVQILPVSERKAFMPRRKSMTTGRGMMSFCNPENIEADNFSNSDEMEMTRCQTIVLEAENYERCKPLDTSRNTLNIASSRPDVDCMEMTQAFTGNVMLKSRITVEERKIEGNLFSTAQSCQMQDWSASGLHQASTSDLAVPCVDDGMEFTNCNTIAIDTLADTDTNIKEIESATSRSSGEQNEIAAKSINQDAHHSNHIPFNLQSDLDTNLSKMDENDKMARSSRVMTTESVGEDDDMQLTKVITMPFETQDSVRLNQTEVANKENFSGIRTEEKLIEGIWPTKEQSENSVQLELSSTSDSFIKEDLQHRKSRRRSLAEFQTELQNMSRRINKEEFIKGATAPLPSCSLPEVSPKEQCETAMSVEPGLNVTPNVKRGREKATPFSLKNKPFSSRISFCGIVPKLTKRSAAVTPNKTVTISTPSLPHFPLEKHLDVEQNSSCVSANINEEELPEMSSEEDFSGSIENWPIHKEDEQVDFLDALKNVEPLEDDVFELNVDTSQSLKRPYLEETSVTAERTKKACISDTGPDCHEGGVQWEGNFTSHVAQNPSAKMIEDTGVSESTLRYSQCDSHIDGTMDYEFDFNKKLENGSITVNEFLSHFGINFVIHKSRPSALPDIRRAGETRTMEDLLKEKYIHQPKQRVYEDDCKELTDIVERLKERTPEQEKSLRCINEALFQEICSLSKEQLKNFGSKLKERRVYFGKRSKAISHEMKGVLYSKLIKTTQDAKQQLTATIKETDEIIDELDGCINDIERELAAVDAMISENYHNSNQTRPALKAKEDDLHKLNSALNEKESEIDQLQIQQRTLEGQEEKLREECSGFKSHLATLNSLNEWRLEKTDERGALFTFLHNTVHLQVKLQTPAGNEWMTEGVEQNMDVSLSFQLNVDKSECHASMVHKLLALHKKLQTQWMQKYPTTRLIPELLHDVSLVVGRLRLLGEEIHRLKRWGGLRLCIRQITCVDTKVHIIFSSLKAFEKFELSLMVTPDYPFGPLQIQDFRNHIGNTRLGQIEDIVSSVKPDKNYLTNILKKIHSDLLS